MFTATPRQKKELEQIKKHLQRLATNDCRKMGVRINPRVSYSTAVDENSAQTYPDGRIVVNDEYAWLNHRNKKIMYNLMAHETAHLADPDPSGTQHDESFMGVYRRFGKCIKDDPLYLGENELLTTPHYALICKECGNTWFYAGKPKRARYCRTDKKRLKTIDIYKTPYLEKQWRKIHARGNKMSKRELSTLFKD